MTIHPQALWVLSRALAGFDLNGEVDALPEPIRGMVAKLADVRVDDDLSGPARQEALAEARRPAWETMSVARPELVRALANGPDPQGPSPESREPEEDSDEGNGWKPIRLGSLPPAPPFPLDVLPPPARDLAKAAARSISCPVDFPAVGILAAASGMIGRSVVLRVKGGYVASGSIYVALVGGPSSGKSPALRAAMNPVWDLSTQLSTEWGAAKKAWEKVKPEDRGDPPELVRLVSSDPTTEALAPILARNPRGVIVAPDEMTKWVMSMDQYKGGKGGDRPFYLSAWSGEPVFIDRAKNMREPIAVPHPFVSVVGGMTPDMLSTLSEGKGREDGFMARLLFTYPERIRKSYSEEGIPTDVMTGWSRMALALWDLPMDTSKGKPRSREVRMSPEAATAWASWCRDHYAEQEADDFPESMEGPWGKLEAYAARLSLVLHLLDIASDPTRSQDERLPDLSARTVADSFRLVAYFKAHALRVHATMGGKRRDGGHVVRAIVKWVLGKGLERFSMRDFGRNFPRLNDDPAVENALEWMIANSLIRPAPYPDGPKNGRTPSPKFEVNPAIGTTPRFRQFRQNPSH